MKGILNHFLCIAVLFKIESDHMIFFCKMLEPQDWYLVAMVTGDGGMHPISAVG